jgi:hypothetical protein
MRSDKTSIELDRISEALIASGHISLDEQAKALGLCRSTAWVIIKKKYKFGRLNTKTIDRILSNTQTPPAVRMLVEQYVAKRSGRKRRASSLQRPVRTNGGLSSLKNF